MKVGELVIYTEGGKDFNALVLGERHIADHMGKQDEPLLSLAFVRERLDSFGNSLPLHGTGQQSELVQFRLDVAHVSHEYDEEQQKKYSRKSYDGGRWSTSAEKSE